jgi:hypothetical protein
MKAGNRKITVLLAILLAGITAYLSNLLFLQSPHFTKYEGVVSLGVFFVFIPIFFFLILKLFTPAYQKNPHKLALIIGSIVLASLTSYLFAGLIFDWQLVPSHKISVEVLSEKNPDSSGNQATLLSLETTYGILSFAEISQSEGWTRAAKSVLENDNRPGETLSWQGRPGALAKLTFASSPTSGKVLINTEQTSEILDLFSSFDGEVSWENEFAIPVIAYLLPLCALWIFLFCIFLFISVYIFPFTKQDKKIGKYYWLLFTLPMLAVWTLYLLAFWPGEMSPDSMAQWGQALTGAYTDAHPPLYAFSIWLITRFWLSPGAIGLFQLLCLSFATAWGLKVLIQNGLNTNAAWFVAIIFALSPLNSTLVISLWKDIPYAIAFMVFSIQILQMIFSGGKWLENWVNCMALVLSSLSIMLFRHNGVPVPVISLIIAILFFRHYWIRLCIIIIAMVFSWVLIRGPVYDRIGVDKTTGFENAVFIHHIAAHVVKGGPLSQDERNLVNLILPVEDWRYDCCNMLPTYDSPNFDPQKTVQYSNEIKELFFKLVLKEPLLEFQHITCVSNFIWSFAKSCDVRVSLIISQESSVSPNSFGITQESKIPIVRDWLLNIYQVLFIVDRFTIYWFPVIYLSLVVISSIMLHFWVIPKKALLFAIPSLVQSMVLLVTNVSGNSYRYQYGVCLVGMLSIGLAIYAINLRFKSD